MMTSWSGNRMYQGMIGLALTAMLGACATTGGGAPAAGYAGLVSQAEAAVTAGRADVALVAFADAAKADPTKKEPWVRSAQILFDRGDYARAIVAAEEVLQRDPDDLVADGILTVSGFRIANHSLQRLRGRGALASATARREAETLAGTLRETMGDDIMGGDAARATAASGAARAPARRASAPAAQAPAARPAANTSQSSGAQSGADPFKNIGGN